MAITQISSLNYVQTAYQQAVHYPLRQKLFYDMWATVGTTPQTNPGTTVTWTFQDDLAVATTPLTETSDITPETMSDSQVTITLTEYGNAVQTTAKLRGNSSIVEVDPVVANIIGRNAGETIDRLARVALDGGTQVTFVGQASEGAITAGDTMTANEVRKITAQFRTDSVDPFGMSYVATIHPDVSYDLRSDVSDSAQWRSAANEQALALIQNAVIGTFEGVTFMETPNVLLNADGGNANVDTYTTYFMGQEGLGKVWAQRDGNGPMPQIVVGPVTDFLRRFEALGWYWMGGYDTFREESVHRVLSASSIGAN